MLQLKLSFLFFVLSLCFSCTESKVVPPKAAQEESTVGQPDQISWNVTVNFIDSSFTKAILKAKRARIYQDKMETLLDGGVIVEFMSKSSGKRASILTADSARIDDKTKNMLARGHVVVIADSSKTKMTTSLLEWNNLTQKLYSTEFVTIDSPKEYIQGWGFESDQNLSNYKIFKVSGAQK